MLFSTSASSQSITLSANETTLGIAPGNVYTLDIFGAERHTTESHFKIDTTLVLVPQNPVTATPRE